MGFVPFASASAFVFTGGLSASAGGDLPPLPVCARVDNIEAPIELTLDRLAFALFAVAPVLTFAELGACRATAGPPTPATAGGDFPPTPVS
jgi:hypothetical protein